MKISRVLCPAKLSIKSAVYKSLILIVAAILTLCLIRGNYENAATCVLTLILLTVPKLLNKKLDIELPCTLEIVAINFVFCANILGEIASFYELIPFWDTLLHTLNGFVCAGVGFGLVGILNSSDKFNLSPVFVCLFSFCFSMTAGVMWEFTEFVIDNIFGKDMQKDTVIHTINTVLLSRGKNEVVTIDNISDISVNSRGLGVGGYIDIGLTDTMKDLFVNLAGAAVFTLAGYLYLRSGRRRARFVERFIPVKTSRDAARVSSYSVTEDKTAAKTTFTATVSTLAPNEAKQSPYSKTESDCYRV